MRREGGRWEKGGREGVGGRYSRLVFPASFRLTRYNQCLIGVNQMVFHKKLLFHSRGNYLTEYMCVTGHSQHKRVDLGLFIYPLL